MLPSDGEQGIGEAREGQLGSSTLEKVGSLEDVVERWQKRLPDAKIIPISALEGINTAEVSVAYRTR